MTRMTSGGLFVTYMVGARNAVLFIVVGRDGSANLLGYDRKVHPRDTVYISRSGPVQQVQHPR
jgi:hypothetical protein